MKCFYHSADFDGECSGAIVRKRYPECEMIGINYGDTFPWETIDKKETVFMVDFSLSFKDLRTLDYSCHLILIDHHKTIIDEIKESNYVFKGVLDANKAACKLCWNFLYPHAIMPDTVKLIGDHDVWNHTNPNTLNFHYGMRLFEYTKPDSNIWKLLLGESPLVSASQAAHEIIMSGIKIQTYETLQNEKRAKAMAFEIPFEGYKAIAMNQGFCNSSVMDSVYIPRKHDLILLFSYNGLRWKVSLYSTTTNCGVIARKYGGGGHIGAAGFSCDILPFKVFGHEQGDMNEPSK